MLVTSCNPLKIFLYEEGLARFATKEYKLEELKNEYIHLTNYAINKNNDNFKHCEDGNSAVSHKRSLKAIYEILGKEGVDIKRLQAKIKDIIIKTLLAIQSELLHNYRMCQP